MDVGRVGKKGKNGKIFAVACIHLSKTALEIICGNFSLSKLRQKKCHPAGPGTMAMG